MGRAWPSVWRSPEGRYWGIGGTQWPEVAARECVPVRFGKCALDWFAGRRREQLA
jgi:hypothetical protein